MASYNGKNISFTVLDHFQLYIVKIARILSVNINLQTATKMTAIFTNIQFITHWNIAKREWTQFAILNKISTFTLFKKT